MWLVLVWCGLDVDLVCSVPLFRCVLFVRCVALRCGVVWCGVLLCVVVCCYCVVLFHLGVCFGMLFVLMLL